MKTEIKNRAGNQADGHLAIKQGRESAACPIAPSLASTGFCDHLLVEGWAEKRGS